jgi:peptide/nickel transport system permease protein
LVVLAAFFAPLISPQNPTTWRSRRWTAVCRRFAGAMATLLAGHRRPGARHAVRHFYGLRISLAVGVISTVFALIIGLTMGLTAAYFGGKFETLVIRIVDIQLSFPPS